MKYRLHVLALAVLVFSTSTVTAQVAAPSPTPLTAQQKSILEEANQLSRDDVNLHRKGRLDEALEWARRCPDPMPGEQAVLEIRPVFEAEDFAPTGRE